MSYLMAMLMAMDPITEIGNVEDKFCLLIDQHLNILRSLEKFRKE